MPLGQVIELNAYIDLMHGISDLAPFILLLQQHAAQLDLRAAWLSTLDFWAITAFSLASYIWFDTKEPVTDFPVPRRDHILGLWNPSLLSLLRPALPCLSSFRNMGDT